MFTRTRAVVPAAIIMLLAGSASASDAIDGYRNRAGGFFGADVAFGAGKVDVEGADGEFLYGVRARGGNGITDKLFIDGELGLAFSKTQFTDLTLFTGTVGVGYYLFDGLHIRAGGGLSALAPDEGDSEVAGMVTGEFGYDFFVNADMAIGFGLEAQHHLYDNAYQVFGFNVSFTKF
jgi:hypothetical protein